MLCCIQGRVTSSNWRHFVPDFLLVLIAIIYIPLTATDIALQLRAKRRIRARHWWQARAAGDEVMGRDSRMLLLSSKKTGAWLVFEGVHCSLLLASMILLMVYVVGLPKSARLEST